MEDFEFYSPTRFVFGRDADPEDIPALVASLDLRGNTLGGFKALTEADVAAILTSCIS